MKQALRVAIAALVGATTFLTAVIGIEFVVWWWMSPGDPMSDPAINAIRFVGTFAFGLGAAFMTYPRADRSGRRSIVA